MTKIKRVAKPRCRCYINATYNAKTAYRTGKFPKACPIHEKEAYEEEQKGLLRI